MTKMSWIRNTASIAVNPAGGSIYLACNSSEILLFDFRDFSRYMYFRISRKLANYFYLHMFCAKNYRTYLNAYGEMLCRSVVVDRIWNFLP